MMIGGLIAYLKELKKLQHGLKISKWIFIYGFMMIVAQALSKLFYTISVIVWEEDAQAPQKQACLCRAFV